jgi:hypothetical protein
MYKRFEEVGEVCYLNFLNFRFKKEISSDKEELHWDIFTMTGLTLNYIMEPFCLAFLK